LIEFGGHSASHPILSKLPDSRIEDEVAGAVRSIETITGRACKTFAYPNGALADFDDRSVESLKGTNVEYAVSTVQARNRRVDDPYRLSRWDVGSDMSVLRFAATLMGLHPSNFKRHAPLVVADTERSGG
jgi:peptidoglycan/xylan/chitin deacetylase (PgdA/CDA1 family)